MSIIESTIAFLFRQSVDPKKAELKQRQKTCAILRRIVDPAEDVAACLIDEKEKANDHKADTPNR